MADSQPNTTVEMQRLRASIASQRSTIEQQRLQILEMADRRLNHLSNIEAAQRAIEDMERNLAAMEQAHGVLTEARVTELADSLGEAGGTQNR